MTAATYIVACLAFCASFVALRLIPVARREMAFLWAALAELNSSGLTDEQKEANVREAGRKALAGVSRLFARLLGVAAATAVPVWLASAAGLSNAHDVTRFAIRYDVMIVTTVVAAGLAFIAGYIAKARNR